ncbi:hypothetical protein KH172YL63_08460 [Bacillus sp. KH172YL63]|nr:hypothetical protein KH172YL63_08460 [Bacillus sp. KH172YL63]
MKPLFRFGMGRDMGAVKPSQETCQSGRTQKILREIGGCCANGTSIRNPNGPDRSDGIAEAGTKPSSDMKKPVKFYDK